MCVCLFVCVGDGSVQAIRPLFSHQFVGAEREGFWEVPGRPSLGLEMSPSLRE